jgi:putative ABC transport system permease protein
MLYVVLTIVGIVVAAVFALLPLLLILFAGEFLLNLLQIGRVSRFLLIMLKSLRRNLLRTSLTYLATLVLVMVVTLVWSLLAYLDALMVEKTKDLKVIVSDKWQAFSNMPWSYARPLSEGAALRSEDTRPQDSMTWQFYVGTLDPAKKTRENLVFFIALEPRKLLSIMDELMAEIRPGAERESASAKAQREFMNAVVQKMESNKRAAILGRERLTAINKRVGERFTVTGMNYSGIDLEFEIVGEIPDSRYTQSAIMNREYLNDALDTYPKTHGGARHPFADKSLNLVWLQVADQREFA